MGRGRGGFHHWSMTAPDEDAGPIRRETVRRVIGAFRPYRGRVSLVGILIVITSSLGVVNPLLIARIFDTALFPKTNNNPPQSLPPDLHLLYPLVALMIL